MRKRYAYILLTLLLAACQQKGSQPQAQPEPERPSRPVAQIEFPEGTEHDFGVFYEKVTQEHDFLVHNPGKVPLVIDSVMTSCGCTSATGPRKPVMEGETDTIHVSYDGNGFMEGFFLKHIQVYSNAGDPVMLKIRGSYFNP